MILDYDDIIYNGFDIPIIDNKEKKAFIDKKLKEKYHGRRLSKIPIPGYNVIGEQELKCFISVLSDIYDKHDEQPKGKIK